MGVLGSRAAGSLSAALVGALASINFEARAEEAKSGTAPSTSVALGYTAEYWQNLEGGVERGGEYLDLLDMSLDWESPVDGLRAHVNLIYTNGNSLSELIGDSHVVSNIEADGTARVLQAWVEYAPQMPDRSIKLGVYDLNSEFDASDVGGALINSTFGIGLDASQSSVSGPSIFPYTGLALRGRWRFDDRWLIQGVIIDAVPIDPDHPRRVTSLSLDSDEGALVVTELERRADAWRAVIGHWRYTEAFETFNSLPSGDPEARRGNSGSYAFVEGPVWEAGGRRLLAMLRVGAARPQFNTFESTVQGALVLERALLKRDGEHLALGVGRARNGEPARRAACAMDERLTTHETVIELSWRAPLSERITLQPDLQYILNPGSAPKRDNALAIGLRVEVDLSPR